MPYPIKTTRASGFTLVEILIVVVILGILAVVIIPQFSNASAEARQSSLGATLKTLRAQIEVYKVDHREQLPNIVGEEADGSHWRVLTAATDVDGLTAADGAEGGTTVFGPYLLKLPINPITGTNSVVDGDELAELAPTTGFVFDYAGGAGTGKLWAVGRDADGMPVVLKD